MGWQGRMVIIMCGSYMAEITRGDGGCVEESRWKVYEQVVWAQKIILTSWRGLLFFGGKKRERKKGSKNLVKIWESARYSIPNHINKGSSANSFSLSRFIFQNQLEDIQTTEKNASLKLKSRMGEREGNEAQYNVFWS